MVDVANDGKVNLDWEIEERHVEGLVRRNEVRALMQVVEFRTMMRWAPFVNPRGC